MPYFYNEKKKRWEWRAYTQKELELMKQQKQQQQQVALPAPKAPVGQADGGPSLLDGLTSRARQLGSFLKRLALGATEAVGHAYSALMNDVLHLDDLTAWWMRKTGLMPNAKPEDFEFQIMGRKRSEEPKYISEGVKEAAEFTGQVLGSILPVGGAAMTGGRLAGSLASRALREAPSLLQKIGTAAATGAGTGLAYGAFNEAMEELGDPERESLKEHLEDIGRTTALFSAYGAAYPFAQRAVDRLGSSLSPRVRERLSTLSERAPELAQAGRGALEGALAGAMVGSGIGAYELLKTGDPQQALSAVTGQAKEEATENIVQGIAFGIAQRLLSRGRVVNPQEVADRVQRKVAEKAPEQVTPEVVQEAAREVEAEYEQTAQEQETAPSPQMPRVTVQKPSLTVETQQEQTAVQQSAAQQATVMQRAEQASAVEQKPVDTAPAPTKTAQVVEVNPGDMVELRGLKDRFTVVSKERSGLIRVRSEKGGETTVHQAAVARVVKPAEQEMIQPAVQTEQFQKQQTTDATQQDQVVKTQQQPAKQGEKKPIPATVHVEKALIEIKFNKKPSSETVAKLKSAGFKWNTKRRVWYSPNIPEAMEVAREFDPNITEGVKGEETNATTQQVSTAGVQVSQETAKPRRNPESELLRKGVTHVGDTTIKVVGVGDGYGVQVTVAGQRKEPERVFPSLEEAQRAALDHVRELLAKGQKSQAQEAPSQSTKTVLGKKAVAKTERGTSVETEFAVVNATDLLTSHDTNLRPVKEYPQELQPRDRSRAASEEQINRIVAKLEPEFLAESPKASEGAPIVGPDLVVESGNARTIALKKAYETKHENAEKYRKWLLENAERFGLDRSAIENMEAPVLVRIRRTDVDRAEFAREANEQSVAAMSATEQALADAKKISGKLMSLFVPDENGNILTRENRDFVTAFFRDVVGPAERARYMTSDGSISQEGIARIRNAVFAKAYGDPAAIEKLAESPDNNVRNITNAMLVAAPRLAKIKEEIEQGNLYDLDITGDLAAAMRKLSELREQGVEVKTYLNQLSLFGDDLSPFAKDLLEVLDEYKRSAKKINALLQAYADVVEAAGNPKQLSLFKNEPPTKAEVLEAALRKVEKEDGATQTSLFENQSVGDHGASAPANSVGTRKGKTEAGGTKREGETGTEEVLALAGGWYPRRTQVGKRDDGVQVEMGIEGATAKKLPEGGTDVRLTPRAARDIADIVAKHLDTVVRVGRLQTPGAKGEYLPRAHAARVKAKHTQDWRVVGHELGHALRTKTGFVGNPQELAALAEKLYPGKVPAKLKVEEGFAEFFQLWVTDPKQAQKLAPRTYEAFEELIGQDPALKDVFDQVRVAVHEDVVGTPLQRALRSIVFPGEKPGKATAGNEYEMNRWKRFKSAVFDSTVPLQDLFNEAAKKGFEGIDGAKLAALAGGARERAIKMFERRATDHLGRYIAGRPLQEIANEAIAHIEKTLPRLKDVDEASGFRILNAIMYAYRYRERAERGFEKNPIAKKDAEELIKWAKEKFGDKIEELVKEYTSTFSKIVLTKLERAGLITPEIRARIEAGSDWYIPTYYATRAPYVSGQVEGGRTVKQPVKRYEGRQEQVYDFMTASLLKLMEVEQAIEYKRVLNAIEEALRLPGMGKFGEFIKPPVRMVKVSGEQLARQVEEFLNDVVDEQQIGDKVFNLFIPEGLKGLGKNEPVVVNRHGDQMVYMRLAPDIYNALVSMKPEQVNGVARMLAKIASVQRYLNITNVRYLTNAIARDLFAAGIQKQGAHNILKGTIRGALLAAGKDPKITDAYIASGAFLSNVEDVLQGLRRASVTDGLLPTEAPGWKRSAKGFFYRVFRTPGEVLRWQEQTQRFPEFVSVVTELAKKHGIDPKIVLDPSHPIPEGKEKVIEKILVEAGYAASEVTVNFNRRGTSEFLRTYGAAVPFLHGTLQGLYRFGREISNPQTRGRALWRTMLYTIPITIAAWMAMRDEEGEDIPSEMRDRYWIFPIPGTRYRIAIAKPYEYAVMANVLERYLDWVYRENDAVARKPLEDLGKMLKETFLPPYMPQWLSVIAQLYANETELGSPIVPRGEQNLSPDLQYGPGTSALSQAITRAWMRLFNDKAPSPRQIDFFIEQMFGGLGRAITAGSDVLLGKKELADLFADGSKVPIIGRLLYDPTEGGSRIMDRFYSDWEKVQRLNQSAEKWAEEYLRTNKKPAGVDKLTERDILMLMAYPVYNKYSQLLSDMRKELKAVESDPNLSAKEKMQYRMRMTYYQKLIAGYLYGYVPEPPKGLGITQQEIEDFLSLLDQLGNEALLNEQKRKGGPSEHAEMIQLLMQAK